MKRLSNFLDRHWRGVIIFLVFLVCVLLGIYLYLCFPREPDVMQCSAPGILYVSEDGDWSCVKMERET